MVDISGLKKEDVLAALYNGSKRRGMTFLGGTGEAFTPEGCKKIIEQQGLYYDYLNGKVMKVNISGDIFDPRLYDRDNGDGKAAKMIQQLRESTKQTNA